MSLTGACQFTAACVKSRYVGIIVLALCGCHFALATECNQGLSAQEKVTQFKQLDAEAEAAMRQHRSMDAVRLYEQAVCLEPNSARGFYGLGVAQAAAGEFVKARGSLQTSDRLQPTTGMPLIMQVRVNFSLKDMDGLKANLREMAARFPHDPSAHATLARFLAEQNLFDLALAEAMRSQEGPGDAQSKLQLAILENTVGAYDDALDNALAVEQSRDAATQVRAAAAGIAGLSYESLHRGEEGVRYLREAIELDPTQPNSYLALADLLEQSQKYLEAVDVLKQGLRNGNDAGVFLLPLGADLVRAERYQDGVNTLRDLLRVAPHTDQAYLSLAGCGAKNGRSGTRDCRSAWTGEL